MDTNNKCYEFVDYWDQRYVNEESYDWCKKYEEFKHFITNCTKMDDNILILGCGNSSLSEDLYRDGYHNITNIDYSSVVIKKMSNLSETARKMTWMVMDLNWLSFTSESFDVIIEKATLDSLLVGEKDPWNISKEMQDKISSILCQVSRMLRRDGHFISLTFAQPHFRKRFLCRKYLDWSVDCRPYGTSFHFYCYTMKKGQPLDPKDQYEDIKIIEEPVTTLVYEASSEEEEEKFMNILL